MSEPSSSFNMKLRAISVGISVIFDLVASLIALITVLSTYSLDVQCCGDELYSDPTENLVMWLSIAYLLLLVIETVFAFRGGTEIAISMSFLNHVLAPVICFFLSSMGNTKEAAIAIGFDIAANLIMIYNMATATKEEKEGSVCGVVPSVMALGLEAVALYTVVAHFNAGGLCVFTKSGERPMEFRNKVNNCLVCADDTPWYLKSGDEQTSCNGDYGAWCQDFEEEGTFFCWIPN